MQFIVSSDSLSLMEKQNFDVLSLAWMQTESTFYYQQKAATLHCDVPLPDFLIPKHDVKQDGVQPSATHSDYTCAVVRRRMTSKRRRVEQKDDTEERAEETETSSSVLKRQRLPAVQHGVQPSQTTPTQNTQRVLGDNYSDCVQPVVKQERQDGPDTKNGRQAASTEQADIAC